MYEFNIDAMSFSSGKFLAEVEVYDEEQRLVGRGTTNLSDVLTIFNHHIKISIDIQNVQSTNKVPFGTLFVRAMVTESQSLTGK